ncbi:MAG: hypothetical protein H6R26_2297 [Proteobacteria bacterium]|nr:hypothetical protein [Pseudomonadota bacterium]
MSNRHMLLKLPGIVLSAGLLAVADGVSAAGDCWLDIYDKTNFEGAHVRIGGPADLPDLSKLEGQDWSSRIDSLIVGPKAQVIAFRMENFKEDQTGQPYHGDAIKNWGGDAKSYSDQEITFSPGQKEHHLGELNYHQNINSLKIRCVP